MKLKVYSVYDSCAQAFIPPFFLQNDAVACRSFGDAANDVSHAFFKNPSDYNLFCIGEFDDSTAVIVPLVPFVNLGMAAQFKEG